MDGLFDALDQLYSSSRLVIDRPAGDPHPRFRDVRYPVDYGYLDGTVGGDGDGVDAFVGSATGAGVVAAVVTVDLGRRDVEVKLLVECSADEVELVTNFLERDLHLGVRTLLRRAGHHRA